MRPALLAGRRVLSGSVPPFPSSPRPLRAPLATVSPLHPHRILLSNDDGPDVRITYHANVSTPPPTRLIRPLRCIIIYLR